MEMSLSLQPQQRLAITPQLRQSIEIMQMSSLELDDFLQQKFIENPFVELKDHYRFQPDRRASGSSASSEWWLNLACGMNVTSLEIVLLEQLNFLPLEKRLHTLCKFVIGCLDANGYLSVPVTLIAEQQVISPDEIFEALRIIQEMEPFGIGAASLKECLLIQLKHLQNVDALTLNLVENDLMSIAQGKINELAHKYRKNRFEVQQAVDRICQLNPKPGSAFSSEPSQFIVPDIVLKEKMGEFLLLINHGVVPHLKINNQYKDMLVNTESKEIRQYLRGQLTEVNWIVHCLDQRKATMLKVAKVIFELQVEFCKYGSGFIEPMTLKQVANVLQIHESTVSRAVNGKYAETPWGIYELKRFFSSSIRQSDGDMLSTIQVKERIQAMIRQENKSRPLSDQKIADQLRAEGIIISRRTITKYREQIKIPATNLRIRFDK